MSAPRRSRVPLLAALTILLRGRSKAPLALAALASLAFAGCAQQPEQLAATSHGKEYFPSSKYGPISRRVVADGQPVPHGGGQYLVGKPYTVAGQTYYPSERHVTQVGTASWYGDAFHGRLTANGEIYDRNGFTAAHPTLPLPSYARVTNLRNNTSIIVRVNDRGPYASNRIMDVSGGVAEALDFKRTGTAKIKVEYVARASLAGSDDAKLLATLRVDGPARWPADPATAVAETELPARVASLGSHLGGRDRRVEAEDDEPRSRDVTRSDAKGRNDTSKDWKGVERERARSGHDRSTAPDERRAAPDSHGELARLIAGKRDGGRDGIGGRPIRSATLEQSSASTHAGAEHPTRMASEASRHSTIVQGHRALMPPQRPSEMRATRGAGRGLDDQHRIRQAGLRMVTSGGD